MEVLQIFQLLAFHTSTLGSFNMFGPGQLLRGCVDVVDQSDGEVGLVPAIVMRTPLSEVVAETSTTMPLFVRVVAGGPVLGKASHRGLGTTTVHFSAWYVLDDIDVPADFILW